ncbi:putative reverse transcriptase domain-containing protein [Tanacetum coccineum]
MFMTSQSSVKDKILATPSETSKVENAPAEMLCDLNNQMEKRADDGSIGWKCNGRDPCIKHPQADGQSEHMIQTLDDMMRALVIDFGGSYHSSIRCAPFEALNGRKCRSPILWVEIGESSLTGLELVQETTNKVVLVKGKALSGERSSKELC